MGGESTQRTWRLTYKALDLEASLAREAFLRVALYTCDRRLVLGFGRQLWGSIWSYSKTIVIVKIIKQ